MSNLIEPVTTASFTWLAIMFIWMLINMVPRVEVWNWKGLLQDVSVVGLVAVLAFFCATVTLRRWFDLSLGVTAVAVFIMAIVTTPIAIRVHQKAHGR